MEVSRTKIYNLLLMRVCLVLLFLFVLWCEQGSRTKLSAQSRSGLGVRYRVQGIRWGRWRRHHSGHGTRNGQRAVGLAATTEKHNRAGEDRKGSRQEERRIINNDNNNNNNKEPADHIQVVISHGKSDHPCIFSCQPPHGPDGY